MDKRLLGLRKKICILFLVFCSLWISSISYADYSFSEDADSVEKAADSVFMLEVYSSSNQKIGVGSGFIAFHHDILITNYHVIDGGAYVIAVSDDKEQYLVSRVCIADKRKDIAILKLDDNPGLTPLVLKDTVNLKRSEKVVAIGSPAGLMNTISIGNISAFYQRDGRDWIQFTAPISSGSSGGALFDDNGNVIGITTATYASTQNINMAVRADDVIELYGKWDGLTTTTMSRTMGIIAPSNIQIGSDEKVGSATVYITGTGKKYHNNPNCSKMRNPIAIDLLDAIEKGYEPCGKCYK